MRKTAFSQAFSEMASARNMFPPQVDVAIAIGPIPLEHGRETKWH